MSIPSHNTAISRPIGCVSPYQVVFGQKPRCGISNLPLDPGFLKKLATEEQLLKACGQEVLDDMLNKSTAENKPEEDLEPSACVPDPEAIARIVPQENVLQDLEPTGIVTPTPHKLPFLPSMAPLTPEQQTERRGKLAHVRLVCDVLRIMNKNEWAKFAVELDVLKHVVFGKKN